MPDKITQAEFNIMDVLWTEAPLAASDVAERLSGRKAWNVRTIKTLLSRLVEKGAVAHRPDGRRYLYRPLISRQSYTGDATRTLIDRLFDGRAAPLVANLAKSGTLSDDDITELEQLLEELKRDSR